MKKKLKTSKDYGQFNFRVNSSLKAELDERINDILDIEKSFSTDENYAPKRNDLILRALDLGLKKIEKRMEIKELKNSLNKKKHTNKK